MSGEVVRSDRRVRALLFVLRVEHAPLFGLTVWDFLREELRKAVFLLETVVSLVGQFKFKLQAVEFLM